MPGHIPQMPTADQKIAEGKHSTVYKYHTQARIYALKVIDMGGTSLNVMQEVKIMSQLCDW